MFLINVLNYIYGVMFRGNEGVKIFKFFLGVGFVRVWLLEYRRSGFRVG